MDFTTNNTIKFLCSYGGKILPRYPEGKLRYHGGHTRVFAVDRSVSFSELYVTLGKMICGASMSLRCQLPNEDLDALVSITSDEDLANLMEEYDGVAASNDGSIKIRAFIFVPKASQKVVPTTSSTTTTIASSSSSNDSVSSSNSMYSSSAKMGSQSSRCPRIPISPRSSSRCYISRPAGVVPSYEKAAVKPPQYGYYGYDS